MPAIPNRTKIVYTCDETGNKLEGYVRDSNPNGANLTVFDPRYKQPASKDDVPFDPDGRRGSFKLHTPDFAPKPVDPLMEIRSPAGKKVVHENEVPVLDEEKKLVNVKRPGKPK